jgi:hypothetical protein
MINKILLIAACLIPLAVQAQPGGGKLAGFLTPEQRAMLMMQSRDEVKEMAPDERKTYRRDEIAKLMGMSDGQREKLKADLQAKWDALPQKRKDRIEERLATRQDGYRGKTQNQTPNQDGSVVK